MRSKHKAALVLGLMVVGFLPLAAAHTDAARADSCFEGNAVQLDGCYYCSYTSNEQDQYGNYIHKHCLAYTHCAVKIVIGLVCT